MTESDDDLRSLRNFFYLGLFPQCMTESKSFDSVGAKVFYYRALLEVKPADVFKQINDRAPVGLQAIRLLATFRAAADDEMKDLAFETLADYLSDEAIKEDSTMQIIAAQMYFEGRNYKEALRLVSAPGEDLEKMAMQMQIYLKIDRLDLATKAAKQMADIDDDDVLTQLATSWLYTCQGGAKITEASFLLQELVDKFGPSPSVLTSQAVCQIHLGNFVEANAQLQQGRALALQTCGRVAAATLVNYIVVLQSLKKPADIIAKITGELRENYPKHAWLVEQASMSAMFDQHAKTYAV